MPEQDQQRMERPQQDRAPWMSKPIPLDGGPQSPRIEKPDTNSILKKMKTVNQDQSKKYKQRTGE